MAKRFDILCLPPQDKPVYFVVPAFDPDGNSDSVRFRYEENSCPVNFFLEGVETIITDNDADPHGLFEFVRTTDELEFVGKGHSPDQEWPKVVPEAYEDES